MESNKPIPAPARSLGKIASRGVAGIQAELIGAPAIHRQFMGGASARAETIQAAEAIEQRLTGQPAKRQGLERGDGVLDLERRKKGTIIRALKAAADGQKRFEIVDSRGDSWKQLESQLRKR